MDNFNVHELIGEGSFGRVFRGSRRSAPEQLVALKLIPKVGHSDREIKSLRSECKIQKELSHPNIVQMLDAFETLHELIAVTEFVPGGDLHKLLSAHKGTTFPEDRVRQLGGDLVSACCYLHSHRVLHRDIKPQNVLITESGRAKLCDFGFARNLGLNTFVLTSIKGTPLYMAPELIEERPYDSSADLWSVGCILYELLVGGPPFSTNSLFQLIKKVRYESVDWSRSDSWSPQCRVFLRGLLEKDPQKRLGWPALLQDPFMAGHLNLAGCGDPAFLRLSESQELAKEIQRQDVSKLTGGGSSQTLLLLARRYEDEKKKQQEVSSGFFPYNQRRRFSEVAGVPSSKQPHRRRPSDVSAAILLGNAQYLSPPPPLVNIQQNTTQNSIIKMPDSEDEIAWIEYLNDKIKDEEQQDQQDLLKLTIEAHPSPIVLERLSTLLMKDFSEHKQQLCVSEFIQQVYLIVEHLLSGLSGSEDEEETSHRLKVTELYFLILLRISLESPLIASSVFFRNSDSNNNGPFLIRDALITAFRFNARDLSATVLDLCNAVLRDVSDFRLLFHQLLIGEERSFMEEGFAKEPYRYGCAVYRIWCLIQEEDLKRKTAATLLSAVPPAPSDPCLKKIIPLLSK